MEGQTRTDDIVRVPANARERFYDSRGYGRPAGAALDLAPVEAAHLLYRGDLDSVDGRGFREYLSVGDGLAVRFLVYKDLRDRGFYCSPTREGWSDAVGPDDAADFLVYPRGKGPWDGVVEHRVHVVGERTTIPADGLDGGVLAVVDEESEITYLDTSRAPVEGTTDHAPPTGVEATLLGDRVVAWDPPEALYEQGFYGQPLDRDDDAVQLSLVEAAYLAGDGVLDIEAGDEPDGRAAVIARGREAEGDRFDRRLAVYTALRDRGVVPKTGFKFGADFRTYAAVESVENLGHSELLVRVLPGEHAFAPRDLALDVRLAHGVRKEMVFALVDGTADDAGGPSIEWLRVQRLTP
ncbi:tRNA-intron lyase [Haloglomus litoreum]|uniref:tRNA-intron lyase n=1 Tax=Haloglomus litoreum TaxID=3034026 RepID=UPI0023E7575A|nr:tRNA-intron lyase [Haloglomus sp. DT116]